MALIDHYEQEIRYFIEEAHRFAEAYPVQARSLALQDMRDRDPYVERLIEAFAFLSGRINHLLQDDFSQLAQDLLAIIWPHYLYPLPSAIILEMTPTAGLPLKGSRIEARAAVESDMDRDPVSTGLPCRFTTTSPVTLRPIVLHNVKLRPLPNATNGLSFTLSGASFPIRDHATSSLRGWDKREIVWEKLGSEPLRLYLHGEPGYALSLYRLFLHELLEIQVRWQSKGAWKQAVIPKSQAVSTSLFSSPESDPLLPYPSHSFQGFRLLEEYFFCPEKFRFIDLDIFKVLDKPDEETDIEVDIIFKSDEYWRIPPSEKNLRLHCTPAVNLFKRAAEPFTLDDSRPYYKIVVDQGAIDHYVSHHVIHVSGTCLTTGKRHQYEPFNTYRHDRGDSQTGYYHLHRRLGVDGYHELLIAVHRINSLVPQVIHIDVTSGNDRVVRELRSNVFFKKVEGIPDYTNITNLTIPGTPSWPRLDGKELWALINCLSLNYNSLQNVDRFKNMLELYDRTADHANRRRINGIKGIRIKSGGNDSERGPGKGHHHGVDR